MAENSDCEKIKTNIQKWLLEEGYKIQVAPNKNALFQFVATDTEGLKTSVIQPTLKLDQIVIVSGINMDETQQAQLQTLENKERLNFLWDLRFGLLNIGVGFSGVAMPLKRIELSYPIFYDGLSKKSFMQKCFDMKRALLFVMWMFDRKFGETKPKADLMVR